MQPRACQRRRLSHIIWLFVAVARVLAGLRLRPLVQLLWLVLAHHWLVHVGVFFDGGSRSFLGCWLWEQLLGWLTRVVALLYRSSRLWLWHHLLFTHWWLRPRHLLVLSLCLIPLGYRRLLTLFLLLLLGPLALFRLLFPLPFLAPLSGFLFALVGLLWHLCPFLEHVLELALHFPRLLNDGIPRCLHVFPVGLVGADEFVEVASSLLDLVDVELENLLLTLPEAVPVADQVVLSPPHLIFGIPQGVGRARGQPLAALLVHPEVV